MLQCQGKQDFALFANSVKGSNMLSYPGRTCLSLSGFPSNDPPDAPLPLHCP